MKKKDRPPLEASTIRETVERVSPELNPKAPPIKTKVRMGCEDCRAENAFHAWSSAPLPAHTFNYSMVLTDNVNIPSGKRAVIELVTATISVPIGERALLRLWTSLGHSPSNLDLALTPHGELFGLDQLVATHALRVYSDHTIELNVSRNNSESEGYAVVCISGYFVDV